MTNSDKKPIEKEQNPPENDLSDEKKLTEETTSDENLSITIAKSKRFILETLKQKSHHMNSPCSSEVSSMVSDRFNRMISNYSKNGGNMSSRIKGIISSNRKLARTQTTKKLGEIFNYKMRLTKSHKKKGGLFSDDVGGGGAYYMTISHNHGNQNHHDLSVNKFDVGSMDVGELQLKSGNRDRKSDRLFEKETSYKKPKITIKKFEILSEDKLIESEENKKPGIFECGVLDSVLVESKDHLNIQRVEPQHQKMKSGLRPLSGIKKVGENHGVFTQKEFNLGDKLSQLLIGKGYNFQKNHKIIKEMRSPLKENDADLSHFSTKVLKFAEKIHLTNKKTKESDQRHPTKDKTAIVQKTQARTLRTSSTSLCKIPFVSYSPKTKAKRKGWFKNSNRSSDNRLNKTRKENNKNQSHRHKKHKSRNTLGLLKNKTQASLRFNQVNMIKSVKSQANLKFMNPRRLDSVVKAKRAKFGRKVGSSQKKVKMNKLNNTKSSMNMRNYRASQGSPGFKSKRGSKKNSLENRITKKLKMSEKPTKITTKYTRKGNQRRKTQLEFKRMSQGNKKGFNSPPQRKQKINTKLSLNSSLFYKPSPRHNNRRMRKQMSTTDNLLAEKHKKETQNITQPQRSPSPIQINTTLNKLKRFLKTHNSINVSKSPTLQEIKTHATHKKQREPKKISIVKKFKPGDESPIAKAKNLISSHASLAASRASKKQKYRFSINPPRPKKGKKPTRRKETSNAKKTNKSSITDYNKRLRFHSSTNSPLPKPGRKQHRKEQTQLPDKSRRTLKGFQGIISKEIKRRKELSNNKRHKKGKGTQNTSKHVGRYISSRNLSLKAKQTVRRILFTNDNPKLKKSILLGIVRRYTSIEHKRDMVEDDRIMVCNYCGKCFGTELDHSSPTMKDFDKSKGAKNDSSMVTHSMEFNFLKPKKDQKTRQPLLHSDILFERQYMESKKGAKLGLCLMNKDQAKLSKLMKKKGIIDGSLSLVCPECMNKSPLISEFGMSLVEDKVRGSLKCPQELMFKDHQGEKKVNKPLSTKETFRPRFSSLNNSRINSSVVDSLKKVHGRHCFANENKFKTIEESQKIDLKSLKPEDTLFSSSNMLNSALDLKGDVIFGSLKENLDLLGTINKSKTPAGEQSSVSDPKNLG